jgi:hypothetical protein
MGPVPPSLYLPEVLYPSLSLLGKPVVRFRDSALAKAKATKNRSFGEGNLTSSGFFVPANICVTLRQGRLTIHMLTKERYCGPFHNGRKSSCRGRSLPIVHPWFAFVLEWTAKRNRTYCETLTELRRPGCSMLVSSFGW